MLTVQEQQPVGTIIVSEQLLALELKEVYLTKKPKALFSVVNFLMKQFVRSATHPVSIVFRAYAGMWHLHMARTGPPLPQMPVEPQLQGFTSLPAPTSSSLLWQSVCLQEQFLDEASACN